MPGVTIVKEGAPCNKMHLVVKGDVLLKSTKSPIEIDVLNGGELLIKEENKILVKKGYISDTLNSFQIGIKCEKQWVGEESVILDEGIYLYSAIAKNSVTTLEINTSDFKSKFPRDYISKLTAAAKTRYEYLISRMKAMTKVSKKIYGCVETKTESLKTVKNKHPNASKNMLINIGNYNVGGIENLLSASFDEGKSNPATKRNRNSKERTPDRDILKMFKDGIVS